MILFSFYRSTTPTCLSKGSSFPSHLFPVFSSLLSSVKFLFPQNFSLRPPFLKFSSPQHFTLPVPSHDEAFSPLWEKTVSGSWGFLEDQLQTIPLKKKFRYVRKPATGLPMSSQKASTEKADWISMGWAQKCCLARMGKEKYTKKSQYNK